MQVLAVHTSCMCVCVCVCVTVIWLNQIALIHHKLSINQRLLLYLAILSSELLTSKPTIPHKNIETNDKFYRKVAFLMYTEMVNFMPQS